MVGDGTSTRGINYELEIITIILTIVHGSWPILMILLGQQELKVVAMIQRMDVTRISLILLLILENKLILAKQKPSTCELISM